MTGEQRALSYECVERFEAWVRAHCPCAFDDPKQEFFRGLLFICEEEVLAAVARERARLLLTLRMPSNQ
jgi:hypothetical protein